MTLKQLRTEKGITQAECAKLFQVSLRTYKRYESDETKISPLKYQFLLQRLSEYGRIDEDHGIFTYAEQTASTTNFLKLVHKYTRLDELTHEVAREFIEKVVVHKAERVDGKKHMRIEIY